MSEAPGRFRIEDTPFFVAVTRHGFELHEQVTAMKKGVPTKTYKFCAHASKLDVVFDIALRYIMTDMARLRARNGEKRFPELLEVYEEAARIMHKQRDALAEKINRLVAMH